MSGCQTAFTVALGPAIDRETIELEAGKDGRMKLVPFALTIGLEAALVKELTLYWIEGYGGGVLVPFGDATNGSFRRSSCSARWATTA